MVKNLAQPCTNVVGKGVKSCTMKIVLALHISRLMTRKKHLSAYRGHRIKTRNNFDKKNYALELNCSSPKH